MLKDKDVQEKLDFCQMYFVKSLRRTSFLILHFFLEKWFPLVFVPFMFALFSMRSFTISFLTGTAGPFFYNRPTLYYKSPKYDDIFYPGILAQVR